MHLGFKVATALGVLVIATAAVVSVRALDAGSRQIAVSSVKGATIDAQAAHQ